MNPCKHGHTEGRYESGQCKECSRQRNRNFFKKNPEYSKTRELKRSHGITLEYYNSLINAQNNRCAICHNIETSSDSRTNKTKPLAVDHDHSTGLIRGLLCSNCNTSLGGFQDSIPNLLSAIQYLQENVSSQNLS